MTNTRALISFFASTTTPLFVLNRLTVIPFFHSLAEFDCLGHWDGPDDQKYLALLDKQSLKDGKPQYRCAVSSLLRITLMALTL